MTTSIEATMSDRGPLPFITVEEAIAFGQARVQDAALAKEAAKDLAAEMHLPLQPKDNPQSGAVLSLLAEDNENNIFNFSQMLAKQEQKEKMQPNNDRTSDRQGKKKEPIKGKLGKEKTDRPGKAGPLPARKAGQEKIFSDNIGDLLERSQQATMIENMANMASYISITTGRDAQFDVGKDKLQLKIGLDGAGNKQVYAYVNDKKVTRDEALKTLAKLPAGQVRRMATMVDMVGRSDTVKQMQAIYGFNQTKMQAVAKNHQEKTGKSAGMQI